VALFRIVYAFDHGVWAGTAFPRSFNLGCSRCAYKRLQQTMLPCNLQVEREKERQRLQLLQARQLAAQAEAAAAAARAAAAALSGLEAAQGDGKPADAAQAGSAAELAASPDRKRRRSEPVLASADHVPLLRRRARVGTRPDGHNRGVVLSCTLAAVGCY